jgi:8-oxo-dGTP pyrophosphatase MutT (NUDIX family)
MARNPSESNQKLFAIGLRSREAAKREMEEEGGLVFDPDTDTVLGSSERVSKDGG